MYSNSLLTYSPPLSYIKVLILSPKEFSIKAFNSEIFSHTSDFFFRKKTHVYLEKSSIKVRRYLDPFMDVIGIVPLISIMYQPQYVCSSVFLPPIELVLRVFSNHTALANSCGFLNDWEALNHGFFL